MKRLRSPCGRLLLVALVFIIIPFVLVESESGDDNDKLADLRDRISQMRAQQQQQREEQEEGSGSDPLEPDVIAEDESLGDSDDDDDAGIDDSNDDDGIDGGDDDDSNGEEEIQQMASILPDLYVPSNDVLKWADSIIDQGNRKGAAGYFESDYFVPHRLAVEDVVRFNLSEARRPLNKVQFLKTYKTGSTTVHGILFRQAYYGSAPMQPHVYGGHILNYEHESTRLTRIKADLLFKHFQIMAGKTTDNLKGFLEKITPNGLLTTIVRDPVSRAISSHLYYEAPAQKMRRTNIEESLREMPIGDNTAQLMHLNLTAKIPKLLEDIDKVDMLLLNRLDESLVLRHFLWGWPLEEMIYIKTNSCGGPRWDGKTIPCPPASFKDRLPKDLAEKIIRQSPIDSLVYQRAVDRHETLVSMIDPVEWEAALKQFRTMQERVAQTCKVTQTNLAYPVVPQPRTLTFQNIMKDPKQFCLYFQLTDTQVEKITARNSRATRPSGRYSPGSRYSGRKAGAKMEAVGAPVEAESKDKVLSRLEQWARNRRDRIKSQRLGSTR